jgi:hypothetical protein
MQWFGRQVDHVNTLWRHCLRLSVIASEPRSSLREALLNELGTAVDPEPLPGHPYAGINSSDANRLREIEQASPLLIPRTSLASPWVSVLTTVAEKSAPIAYGMAALFAMQRLLDMVITWQRHRFDLIQKESTVLRSAQEVVTRHASEELAAHQGPAAGSDPESHVSVHFQGNTWATIAVKDLAPVLEARMVDENDPLARG